MTPEKYYFGTRLAARFDFSAFRGVGGRYLRECCVGLFDLVSSCVGCEESGEGASRLKDLNSRLRYVLRLRNAGVPFQPVHIDFSSPPPNERSSQAHGPLIVLIRDPHSTIYRLHHRSGDMGNELTSRRIASIRKSYWEYQRFYDSAFAKLAKAGSQGLLVRYESLRTDPTVLKNLAEFVGVEPKLSPDFVHWWMEAQIGSEPRTGSWDPLEADRAWMADARWQEDLRKAGPGEFGRYGYAEGPVFRRKFAFLDSLLNSAVTAWNHGLWKRSARRP